ncbi:uncharacterized protein LOC62_01G000529 [Vanrija pseudolonga]|uniref:Uncharacterized protein n=1 Tax=Vanrija pseudolonga TaxID=143232 RepID=A0AAF0XZM4_9TREE|nr:hypothetical protein LOC62_01G000529 [Vanrija pseudolonga]
MSRSEELYEHYYRYFRHCELTATGVNTPVYTFGLPWAIAHGILSAKCTYPGALGAFFVATRAPMIFSVDFPRAASRLDDITRGQVIDEAVRLATSTEEQVTPTKRPHNDLAGQAEPKKRRPATTTWI